MVRFQKKRNNDSKRKKAAILTVLVLVGTCVYFVGDEGVGNLIERIHPQIHKKLISVKPKILRTAHKPERNPFSENEFTFFRVLNDPGMDEIVGLNGQVGRKSVVAALQPGQRKPQRVKKVSAPRRQKTAPKRATVVAPAKKPVSAPAQTEALVANAQPAEAAKPVKSVAKIPTTFGKFTIQVSSFAESRHAQGLKENLKLKGYPVFILKSEHAGTHAIRHRVYIGKFQDRKSASRAASKIRQAEKLGTLIVQHKG